VSEDGSHGSSQQLHNLDVELTQPSWSNPLLLALLLSLAPHFAVFLTVVILLSEVKHFIDTFDKLGNRFTGGPNDENLLVVAQEYFDNVIPSVMLP
jgi:hypothetical protein